VLSVVGWGTEMPYVLVNPITKEPTEFPLPEHLTPITSGPYQNAVMVTDAEVEAIPMAGKTLSDIVTDVVYLEATPGQHSCEAQIQEILRRCKEASLEVTEQDVRREYRAAAGFP
jgi:hypothetical protein